MFKNDKESKVGLICLGFAFFMVIWNATILPGMVTGVCVTAGLVMTYYQSSDGWKRFILKHRIAFDFVFGILIPLYLGSNTAIAVIAAAINGILLSLFLKYEYMTTYPQLVKAKKKDKASKQSSAADYASVATAIYS